MIRHGAILTLSAVVVLLAPSLAHAQRGGRGGVVVGVDGPLYDTRTPEWRMSGGDIDVYQQLMYQKALMQQQQQMLKYQQQLARQKKQPGTQNTTPPKSPASDLNYTPIRGRQKRKRVLTPKTQNATSSGTTAKAVAPKATETKKPDESSTVGATKP